MLDVLYGVVIGIMVGAVLFPESVGATFAAAKWAYDRKLDQLKGK